MRKLSILTLLFVMGLSMSLLAQEEKLDKYPKPVGGIEAIAKHIKYPAEAKKNNLEGKVFVEAVIAKDGTVESTSVKKGFDKACDAAAEKAVKAVKFSPGIKDGRKVKASVVIPITFKLK